MKGSQAGEETENQTTQAMPLPCSATMIVIKEWAIAGQLGRSPVAPHQEMPLATAKPHTSPLNVRLKDPARTNTHTHTYFAIFPT